MYLWCVCDLLIRCTLVSALSAAGTKSKANDQVYSHIVNVTALEGKFNVGKKSGGHPHTNMAKAALNMMTLTGARDYARTGILMNSVDTVRSPSPTTPLPNIEGLCFI